MKRQIVALGGGGFSMEADNLALDQYILSQAIQDRPKVCFLGTASGDAQGYIDRFHKAYNKLDCSPTHLSLFKPDTSDIEEFILSQNIILVGGGNTKSMLSIWKEWQLDKILIKAYEQGIILSGLSAGSICWFEQGLTDSIPGNLNPLNCLGILPGSHCPHYDGEASRRPAYERFVSRGEMLPGIAADDGVALHYVDEKLERVMSSRSNVNAYKISKVENTFKEEVILPTALPPVRKHKQKTARVFSGSPWEKQVGYCRAIKIHNQIFVTGTVSVDDSGSPFAPGDAYAQARRCFKIIEESLSELGASLSQVARTRMFVTDISQWQQFGKAHKEVFGDHPPATTMVEVNNLINSAMLVEVEADAVII